MMLFGQGKRIRAFCIEVDELLDFEPTSLWLFFRKLQYSKFMRRALIAVYRGRLSFESLGRIFSNRVLRFLYTE